MEVKIEKKLPLILAAVSRELLKAFFLFIVAIILFSLLLPQNFSEAQSEMALFGAMALSFLFLIWHAANAIATANKTRIALTSNGVEMHTGTIFNENGYTYTFHQLVGLNFAQTFVDKLFNICSIHVQLEDGTIMNIWGFEVDQIKKFLSRFLEESKIRIKTN